MKVNKITILALTLAAFMLMFGCAQTGETAQSPEPVSTVSPEVPQTAAPTEEPVLAVTFTSMETDIPFEADLDGDGAMETLLLTEAPDETAGMESSVYLTVTMGGKQQRTKLVPALFFGAYYLEAGDKKGLAVSGTFENDYQITYMYLLEGVEPKELSVTDGGIVTAENGAAVLMSRLYALGTWGVEIEYQMNADFKLVPVEGKEWTIYGCETPLTVKKPLPVQMESNGSYVEETLPAGTKLWLTAGDGTSYVRFVLEDNRQGTLSYEMENGIATLVDGTPDMEWLDGIIYAG